MPSISPPRRPNLPDRPGDPAATSDRHRLLRREMVEEQIRGRGIADARVLAAMEALPRHEFVPVSHREEAYDDRALPIGFNQTISQPYMVGLMLSLLEVEAEHRVLEVGAGSGYVAALLGTLCDQVYGLELVPELAQRAADTMRRLQIGNVHILAGDGTVGHPDAAPFHRIIVSAAAPSLPEPLAHQLAEGGKIVAPVGGRLHQVCEVWTKTEGKLAVRHSIGCLFVPLLGEHGWKDGCP